MPYLDGLTMYSRPVANEPEKDADTAEGIPRIASGKTWEEYERDLRSHFAALDGQELERLVSVHRRIFDRHAGPHPVADERDRSYQSAYERAWPSASAPGAGRNK